MHLNLSCQKTKGATQNSCPKLKKQHCKNHSDMTLDAVVSVTLVNEAGAVFGGFQVFQAEKN